MMAMTVNNSIKVKPFPSAGQKAEVLFAARKNFMLSRKTRVVERFKRLITSIIHRCQTEGSAPAASWRPAVTSLFDCENFSKSGTCCGSLMQSCGLRRGIISLFPSLGERHCIEY
jgi:hypothetical protein